MMDYVAHLIVLVTVFTILAVSLDLLVGKTGIVSLAHAAFFGIGAYTSGLLALKYGVSFPLCLLGATGTGIAFSVIVSLPSAQLHDDYLVICTFGFQMIVFTLFNNLVNITGGSAGLSAIPQPVILGWKVDTSAEFLCLACTIAVVAFVFAEWISASPFGRVLRAIREDEVFAQSLGKNTFNFKVTIFGVAAGLAAAAGSIYAHYISYIDPSSFTAVESILILSMVIVGGAGSRWGPVAGALLIVLLPEGLRFVGLPSVAAANVRQIVYGALLVMVMLIRPQGLVGEYDFGKRASDS